MIPPYKDSKVKDYKGVVIMKESTKIRMTQEQAIRVMSLSNQFAWMMAHKAPHLTHDELTSEFQMVCITIYNKYGFEEVLFKRACHARLVDLVRFNYKYGTYSVDDDNLISLLNQAEPSETTSTDSASHKSIMVEYETNSVFNALKSYLYEVFKDDEKKLKYVQMRLFFEGAEYSEELLQIFRHEGDDSKVTSRLEGKIADALGYANGSSSGGYKMIKYYVQTYVAYFMHMNDLEESLPTDWRDLGDEYYDSKSWLKSARSYLATHSVRI